jgi:hypothetical protein
VLEQLAAWYGIADEIDAAALARLLGTTQAWVNVRAARSRKGAPRLVCKRAPDGGRVRGSNNRLVFDVEDVSRFVTDVERMVTRVEAPNLGTATLPLVSAADPRIGTLWNTLEMLRGRTAARWYGATTRPIGDPTAFFISNAHRGYSVAWPGDGAFRPIAANENAPMPIQTHGGAEQ